VRGLPSLAARRRRRIRPSHHTTIPLVSHHTAIVAHHDPSRWEGLLAAQRHLCSLATSHTGPHAPRRTTALRRRACGHRWRWRRRRPTPEALCRRCGGCAFYVLILVLSTRLSARPAAALCACSAVSAVKGAPQCRAAVGRAGCFSAAQPWRPARQRSLPHPAWGQRPHHAQVACAPGLSFRRHRSRCALGADGNCDAAAATERKARAAPARTCWRCAAAVLSRRRRMDVVDPRPAGMSLRPDRPEPGLAGAPGARGAGRQKRASAPVAGRGAGERCAPGGERGALVSAP